MRYTDSLLDPLRLVGDPDVDAFMPGLMHGRKLEQVNSLLQRYVVNGQEPPEQLPMSLRTWLGSVTMPATVDRARLERASQVFLDHGVSIAVVLTLVSLLECYAAAKGVKALHATDRMGYSGARRRTGETSQFLLAVMKPGALLDGGGGVPVILKVRLMHAAARFLIQESGWDEATLGVPANQEDLLGTLMAFAHTPMKHLPALGVRLLPSEAEDFLYFWTVVGQLLGIRGELMPGSVAEAEEVVRAIARRHFRSSPEGIELTRALLDTLADFMPGRVLDGVFPALARHLAGDELCDMLRVPTSRWQLAMSGQRFVGRLFDASQRHSSVVNDVINKLGITLLTTHARLWSEGRTSFRIPTEIRRAWKLPPLNGGRAVRVVLAEVIGAIAARFHHTGPRGDARWQDHVVELAVVIARADGSIDDFEREALVNTLAALGLDPGASDARIDEAARRVRQAGPARTIERLAAVFDRAGAMNHAVAFAVAIAYANTGIAPEERSFIEHFAGQCGIRGDALAVMVDRTRRRLESA